jgi:hypothetical protein
MISSRARGDVFKELMFVTGGNVDVPIERGFKSSPGLILRRRPMGEEDSKVDALCQRAEDRSIVLNWMGGHDREASQVPPSDWFEFAHTERAPRLRPMAVPFRGSGNSLSNGRLNIEAHRRIEPSHYLNEETLGRRGGGHGRGDEDLAATMTSTAHLISVTLPIYNDEAYLPEAVALIDCEVWALGDRLQSFRFAHVYSTNKTRTSRRIEEGRITWLR